MSETPTSFQSLEDVLKDIEEANAEESQVKVEEPKIILPTSHVAAQERITQLNQKKQQLESIRQRIRGSASAGDFLDGVIDAVNLENEIKGSGGDEFDVCGN